MKIGCRRCLTSLEQLQSCYLPNEQAKHCYPRQYHFDLGEIWNESYSTNTWKGYVDLSNFRCVHLDVNHSTDFVDPETHTNSIIYTMYLHRGLGIMPNTMLDSDWVVGDLPISLIYCVGWKRGLLGSKIEQDSRDLPLITADSTELLCRLHRIAGLELLRGLGSPVVCCSPWAGYRCPQM